MSKKTPAPEVVETAVELPEVPARFSNGGAPAHERDAWLAEHRPDLLPQTETPDDTSTSDVPADES